MVLLAAVSLCMLDAAAAKKAAHAPKSAHHKLHKGRKLVEQDKDKKLVHAPKAAPGPKAALPHKKAAPGPKPALVKHLKEAAEGRKLQEDPVEFIRGFAQEAVPAESQSVHAMTPAMQPETAPEHGAQPMQWLHHMKHYVGTGPMTAPWPMQHRVKHTRIHHRPQSLPLLLHPAQAPTALAAGPQATAAAAPQPIAIVATTALAAAAPVAAAPSRAVFHEVSAPTLAEFEAGLEEALAEVVLGIEELLTAAAAPDQDAPAAAPVMAAAPAAAPAADTQDADAASQNADTVTQNADAAPVLPLEPLLPWFVDNMQPLFMPFGGPP